ncbi:MAG: 2-dehydropantoate 2-reductase [Tannerella sp.]|jgi:2-dehydropantoate 2-reductase|nr:2-dehydropantoate 2-reductase [Tannerella sp.]
MKKIRIAFSGIGAVGGYYGGKMAAKYDGSDSVEIIFIARGRNREQIEKNGLIIKSGSEEIKCIPVMTDENAFEIGAVDYLFCCTKSYDLKSNIEQLKPIIHPDTVLVPLLNGADISEYIQTLLPEQEVWKGCVYIGARLISPGYVHKFSEKEQLFFGSKNGDRERQVILLRLLTEAGINAFVPEDIDERIWKKFIMISTAATITSYYDLPIGEIIRLHYDEFLALGNEAASVAAAKGIILPEDIAVSSVEAQKMMPEGSTTSMHADFKKGGQTELESLTGYIVRSAKESGIETPYYNRMYDKLKAI